MAVDAAVAVVQSMAALAVKAVSVAAALPLAHFDIHLMKSDR